MYKRAIFGITALLIATVFSITACGKESDEGEEIATTQMTYLEEETALNELTTSQESIIVTQESIIVTQETTSRTEAETTIASETSTSLTDGYSENSYLVVPDIPANLADVATLSYAVINGVEVDISNIYLEDLLAATDVGYFEGAAIFTDTPVLYFDGGMFGNYDPNTPLENHETLFSVECIDNQGKVISSLDYDQYDFSNYKIKGISTNDFWLGSDYDVLFYGGIKSGMLEKDFISIMGEGTLCGDETTVKRVYKTTYQTLVVGTAEKTNEAGQIETIIDDITLLNNF